LNVALLVGGLAIILVGAELFTNGIEWFGRLLNFSEGAVGSIFAAIGTALPETLVPVVAIVFNRTGAGEEIGTGAILGAPFMLSTLAMFVTGAAALGFRSRRGNGAALDVDRHRVARDLRVFLGAYAVAIGTVFVPWRAARIGVAILLACTYAYYVYVNLREDAGQGGDLAPLHFHRSAPGDPHLVRVAIQVLVGLGCILLGADSFVRGVDALAVTLGVPALVLALVLSPIATELPESFNALIWVRQGKDVLAVGNVTGAMVFQSCIPTILGITLTAWTVTAESAPAFVSAGIAAAVSLVLLLSMRLGQRLAAPVLMLGGIWYVGYVVYLFAAK
jgi:cation:H+ antiporter